MSFPLFRSRTINIQILPSQHHSCLIWQHSSLIVARGGESWWQQLIFNYEIWVRKIFFPFSLFSLSFLFLFLPQKWDSFRKNLPIQWNAASIFEPKHHSNIWAQNGALQWNTLAFDCNYVDDLCCEWKKKQRREWLKSGKVDKKCFVLIFLQKGWFTEDCSEKSAEKGNFIKRENSTLLSRTIHLKFNEVELKKKPLRFNNKVTVIAKRIFQVFVLWRKNLKTRAEIQLRSFWASDYYFTYPVFLWGECSCCLLRYKGNYWQINRFMYYVWLHDTNSTKTLELIHPHQINYNAESGNSRESRECEEGEKVSIKFNRKLSIRIQ